MTRADYIALLVKLMKPESIPRFEAQVASLKVHCSVPHSILVGRGNKNDYSDADVIKTVLALKLLGFGIGLQEIKAIAATPTFKGIDKKDIHRSIIIRKGFTVDIREDDTMITDCIIIFIEEIS